MDYAPIAVFAYKRPQHLRRTLESLKRCTEMRHSPLFVFCDGPRTKEEYKAVEETRSVAKLLLPGATFIERDANIGLANSVVDGMTCLTQEFGNAIAVEDDLEVSPNFLAYLNCALATYRNDDRVMHVSAYMYPIRPASDRTSVVFLPTIGSWGWATWRRAWMHFDKQAEGWQQLKSDPQLRFAFDLNGNADFSSMLYAQMEGRIDSWVIRWYWTVFQRRGLVAYPPRTLVLNRGFDGTGTHGSRYTKLVLGRAALSPPSEIEFPSAVALSQRELTEVEQLLRSIFGGPIRRRLRNTAARVRKLMRRQ